MSDDSRLPWDHTPLPERPRRHRPPRSPNPTLHWLMMLEALACDLYGSASEAFRGDPALSSFLGHLAADEAEHLRILQHSAGPEVELPEELGQIDVDTATRARIERPLMAAHAAIRRGELTEEELFQALVDSELSEWNDIFLFVVETLQRSRREFQAVAARIQAHERRLEQFLSSRPVSSQLLEQARALPSVWQVTVLVVEDSRPLARLFERLLQRHCKVEVVGDGEAALERLQGRFFDVVVSDLHLPGLDGASLYRQATAVDPSLTGRFVFCSGSREPVLDELAAEGLAVLHKPIHLHQLWQAVDRVLHQQPE